MESNLCTIQLIFIRSSSKSLTDTQKLNFNIMCAYLYCIVCSKFGICLGLRVCLSVCVVVYACKVSTSLCRALSYVCARACARSQRRRQRPAPLWVMVGWVGPSTGLSQTPLFSSGPANGLFVWGTQHERPASLCLLIYWSAQATVMHCCFPFSFLVCCLFLLFNGMYALLDSNSDKRQERYRRKWMVECDKWAADLEICARPQSHIDTPVIEYCSLIKLEELWESSSKNTKVNISPCKISEDSL